MLPAFIAAPLAIKAAIVTVTVGACACVVLKSRPSTLIRVAEDASIKAGKAVAAAPMNLVRGAKRLGHETSLEYRARQIDLLQQAVVTQAVELRNMAPEKRAQMASDEARVFARAEELRAKREGRQAKDKAPRASRAGRSVTA